MEDNSVSKEFVASSYQEIAHNLAVTEYTLTKWLRPFQEVIGKPEIVEDGIPKFSPRQVSLIFEKLHNK